MRNLALGLAGLAAAMSVAAAPASAASLPPLGKPPKKCGAGFGGGSGCYGRDAGPNFLDDMAQAELTVSPHRMRVGDTFTVQVQSIFTSEERGFSLTVPESVKVKCPTDKVQSSVTCTGRAVRQTPAWETIGLNFSGGVEQDYFAVRGHKEIIGGFLKGRVTDSFREGVDNVRITADGPGGSKTSVTTDDGYFQINLAQIKKPTTYKIRAFSRVHDQIDPKVETVTVKPGGTGYARFSVATGIIKGTVRELLCPAPVVASNCRKRQPRPGAVLQIHGKNVSKKFVTTDASGGYRIKVPVGDYTVWVQRLDVAGNAPVCREDPAIPALAGNGRDPKPVRCARILGVKAAKGAYTTRDFIAVPNRIVASMDLLQFRRGQRRPSLVSSILAGVSDPVERLLFGEAGTKGDDFPSVRCRGGCANIELLVRDLFAHPVEDFSVEVFPSAVTPDRAVTPGNEFGRTCMLRANDSGAPSVCVINLRVENSKRGRATGIYAPPGVVDGAVLQEPAATVTTPVRLRVDAKGARDVVSGSLTIRPNRVGRRGSVALSQGDADLLNFYTASTLDRWLTDVLLRLAPRTCEQFERYLANKVFDGVGSVRIRGRTVRIAVLSQICEGLKTGKEVAQPLLNSFDDRYISLALLQMTRNPLPGLIDVFGFGTDVSPEDVASPPSPKDIAIRLIPRNATAATGFVADWVRAWRAALGRPFKAGDRFSLQIHEVTHYTFPANNFTVTPAIHLSLFSPVLPAPTNLLVTQDYDPFIWLNSQP